MSKLTRRIRARLHGDLAEEFTGLNQKLGQLRHEVEDVKSQIEKSNQDHAAFEQIKGKINNSGHISVSDREIVTKIFSGLKLYLDPKDLSFTPHAALDGIWEAPITWAWLRFLKPNSTVFDVGANFGYFGAIAAQRTDKKTSKVVLFEPNPDLIPYMNKTMAVNWLKEQSVVENLAVGDKDGEVTLNILKDYVASSSIHSAEFIDSYMHGKMDVKVDRKVKIPLVSLDSYCRKHGIKSVDLIKMDIEGYEEKAYDGMKEVIKNSPNLTLFLEFTKPSYDDPKAFYDRMVADFGNVYLINSDGRLIRPKKADYESVIESSDDWVMPVFSKIGGLGEELD